MTLIELRLVDGVDINTWWCNWWWINQCKWRCTFTLLLVNTYVRWFRIVESLLVCPCITVILSHMWNVVLHMMYSWHHGVTTSEVIWYHMHLEESRILHAFIIW